MEFKLTTMMKEMQFEKQANEKLATAIAGLPFQNKKALKLFKKAIRVNNEIWELIHATYPETKKGNWSFDTAQGIIYPSK